ncbi:MAG: alpha/beta hydrolase [Pseudomonadota bacterium]
MLIAATISTTVQAEAPKRDIYLTPDIITDETGRTMAIERGLIFVPENRRDPDTRMIPLHVFRAPALAPETGRAPFIYLEGGPGYVFLEEKPDKLDLINSLRQTRDFVYIGQRGNTDERGLVPNMAFRAPSAPLDKPGSLKETGRRLADSYERALRRWNDAGVDMRGYDMDNAVDDIYETRAALGYDKIVLCGCSFGAQWSFAYIKRWPETVDRALLSGIEPLDFTYDSPDWLWATAARVAEEAEAYSAFAGRVPEGGLMKALQTVIKRLDETPVTVDVKTPNADDIVSIRLNGDDLRIGALNIWALGGSFEQSNLARWPKFVLELYEGDYRMLALIALADRTPQYDEQLFILAMDNSLGISPARDKKLRADTASQWIAPNLWYEATRNVAGAPPEVDDDFRKDAPIDPPVLMFSGDFDLSTPIENARHAEKFLNNGKLITVKRATHCPLWDYTLLRAQRPEETEAIYRFVDLDFEKTPASSYFEKLPATITLDPLEFASPETPALYEQILAQAGR